MTDGQWAISWAHLGPKSSLFYFCQTSAGFLLWDALIDERSGLSFTMSADPRQRSHSRTRLSLTFHRQAEAEVTLRLSVCLGVEPTLQLVARYYFLSERCCLKIEVLSL
jgi:hypothetical protein